MVRVQIWFWISRRWKATTSSFLNERICDCSRCFDMPRRSSFSKERLTSSNCRKWWLKTEFSSPLELGTTSAEGECLIQARCSSWHNLHPTPGLSVVRHQSMVPASLGLTKTTCLAKLLLFSSLLLFLFLVPRTFCNKPLTYQIFVSDCFSENLTRDSFQRVTQDRKWNQTYLAIIQQVYCGESFKD